MQKITLTGKSNRTASVFQPARDNTPQLVLTEGEPVADAHPASGFDERRPGLRGGFTYQEHLNESAGRFAPADESHREDARIIEYENIASAQPAGKVLDVCIFKCAGAPIQHQQAGLVTRFAGMLGNAFRGKVVVQVGKAHWLRGVVGKHGFVKSFGIGPVVHC